MKSILNFRTFKIFLNKITFSDVYQKTVLYVKRNNRKHYGNLFSAVSLAKILEEVWILLKRQSTLSVDSFQLAWSQTDFF